MKRLLLVAVFIPYFSRAQPAMGYYNHDRVLSRMPLYKEDSLRISNIRSLVQLADSATKCNIKKLEQLSLDLENAPKNKRSVYSDSIYQCHLEGKEQYEAYRDEVSRLEILARSARENRLQLLLRSFCDKYSIRMLMDSVHKPQNCMAECPDYTEEIIQFIKTQTP